MSVILFNGKNDVDGKNNVVYNILSNELNQFVITQSCSLECNRICRAFVVKLL